MKLASALRIRNKGNVRVQRARPPASSEDLVDSVSRKWVRLVRKRYNDFEKRMLPELLRSTTGNVLLDAVFIGLVRGKIEVREVSITFDRSRAEKYRFAPIDIAAQPWDITDQPVLKMTGHFEIAYEFSVQSSLRAKAEGQRWNLEMLSHSDTDREALNVLHLVDVSIKYAPFDWGIGGEIDEAELNSVNGIRWLHRKAECQEKSGTGRRQSPKR